MEASLRRSLFVLDGAQLFISFDYERRLNKVYFINYINTFSSKILGKFTKTPEK